MLSTAQAGVATTTAAATAVSMAGPGQVSSATPGGGYSHIQFVNLSAVDGWGSIDGGASWVYIPAGKGASNTIDTYTQSLTPMIQRITTDITVFVSAF